ncbi:Zinc finger CCCH domain-containing protein 41, partial [Bienertia sinuspersici]
GITDDLFIISISFEDDVPKHWALLGGEKLSVLMGYLYIDLCYVGLPDARLSKFEKRRAPGVNFSRFSSEHGPGRGRGRDFLRDSRFGPVDVVSQMAHPGPFNRVCLLEEVCLMFQMDRVHHGMGFGLLPAIPNGAIDAMNPLGLPGILRPQLNPSLNMGIQRQRCRDFEERGFCMRGDMCPMEHGVNRIVVEDVQWFMPPVGVSSGTLMNSRGHIRTSKSATDDENLAGAANSSGADVYDPDQPLWNNDGHETSTSLLGLQPPIFDESEPFMDADLADRVIRSSGQLLVHKAQALLKATQWWAIGAKGVGSTPKLQNDAGLMEEAERALKAPDAVMGSRFIKLWWANRDSVSDEGINSVSNVISPQPVSVASGSPHLAAVNKGKENAQHSATKVVVSKAPDNLVTVGNDVKPIAVNSSRVKGDVSAGQAVKKAKVEISADVPKSVSTKSTDANASGPSLQVDEIVDKNVNMENLASQKSKSNSADVLQDPPNLKHTVRSMASSAPVFPVNRYKLDNRPTTIRINAPLPVAFANNNTYGWTAYIVMVFVWEIWQQLILLLSILRNLCLQENLALKLKAASYCVPGCCFKGSLFAIRIVSNVDIEDSNEEESPEGHINAEAMKNCSARVSFATRHAAERAFLNGKSWQGYNLQFSWVTSSIPSTSRSSGESSSALKGIINAEVQSKDKTKHDNDSQSVLGHKECKFSPCKSSNELSGDSSRFNNKRNSPPAAMERETTFELNLQINQQILYPWKQMTRIIEILKCKRKKTVSLMILKRMKI